MPFRQFLRRRIRRRVDDREIEMRIGVIRIIVDRFEHFFLRRFLPAFLAGGDAEVIVRLSRFSD